MTDTGRTLRPGGTPRGRVVVPGDKSLSHRSLLFAGLAPGSFTVRGLSDGDDVHATAAALRALGVPIEREGDTARVGEGTLREPEDVIDCGNSGTSMRLLAGVLAGIDGHSVLTGDVSLRSRPMARIAEPLRRMGAGVDGRDGGRLAPLSIRGGRLQGIEHTSPVASAQVKSCLLLAGLRAEGTVVVREPHRSRDHTERMLAAFGVGVDVRDDGVMMQGGQPLVPPSDTLTVPADISAAAFFLVLAALHPEGDVTVPGVGVTPTRDGVLEALERAGVTVERGNERIEAGEPVADLRVRGGAELRSFEVGGALVPRLIDEIPILAVLAARCPDTTVFRDAADLRAKESDRIASTVALLRAFGVAAEARPDGLLVHGRPDVPLAGGTVDAVHDHRIAMSAAVAATLADAPARILGDHAVDSSFPGFFPTLERCLGH